MVLTQGNRNFSPAATNPTPLYKQGHKGFNVPWHGSINVSSGKPCKYLVFSSLHISSSKSSTACKARTCAENLELPRDTTVGMMYLCSSNTNITPPCCVCDFLSESLVICHLSLVVTTIMIIDPYLLTITAFTWHTHKIGCHARWRS